MGKRLRQSRPDQERIKNAKVRLDNPERIRLARLRFNHRHPGRAKELHDRWMSNPKNRARQNRVMNRHFHRRRAVRLSAPIGDLKEIENWEESWRRKVEVQCEWCSDMFPSDKAHVDHITALILGGKHELSNLARSCRRCNLRKNSKSLGVWLELLFGRSFIFPACDRTSIFSPRVLPDRPCRSFLSQYAPGLSGRLPPDFLDISCR